MKRKFKKNPKPLEKKRKLRSIYRQCRDKENESLKKAAAIAVLTEYESQRAYQRKRKRQYFDTPPSTKKPKVKSHSPDFSNVSWNKEEVLHDLQQHPQFPPPINWQQFARDHNVPGSNAGQMVKEFAQKSGIDTTKLDGRCTDQPRSRIKKRKLIGGEISVPSTPTPATIKDEWKKMVQSGEVSLGVSCVPYKMEKFSTKNGKLERTEIAVFGRKFPLLDLRKKFLAEHEPYMRLQTDEQIDAMSLATLRSTADQYHHQLSPDATIEEFRTTIKHFQRSRSLILWHDHGTILGLGCILITVHVAYDPAIFYTQSEYEK